MENLIDNLDLMTSEEVLKLGLNRFDNHKLYECISIFSKLIERKKENNNTITNIELGQAYFYIAKSKYYLKNYNNAIEDFKKAIEHNFDKEQCYFNIAFCYIKQYSKNKENNYCDYNIISNFDYVLNLNPKNETALFFRGVYKYHFNDFDGALSDLYDLLRINPKYLHAYEYIGYCYIGLNNKNNYRECREKHDSLVKEIHKQYGCDVIDEYYILNLGNTYDDGTPTGIKDLQKEISFLYNTF